MRAVLAGVLLLAACSPEPSAEEQARADALASQRVAAVNDMAPPLAELAPELISDEDINAHAMQGAGCRYMPGTNHGLRVVAREGDAFIKLNGAVERMAADSGSPQLPAGTRRVYNGRSHALHLTIAERRDGALEGSLTLRDAWNRVTWAGTGEVVCAAEG